MTEEPQTDTDSHWVRNASIAVALAVIGVLGTIIVAKISQPPAPAPKPAVTIAEPSQDSAVPMSGMTISGTATNLPDGETLWLLDFDPKLELYFQDNTAPIPVEDNGAWTYEMAGIGDRPGQRMSIVAVRADPSCGNEIATRKPDKDGDIIFTNLPKGCTMGDELRVVITK